MPATSSVFAKQAASRGHGGAPVKAKAAPVIKAAPSVVGKVGQPTRAKAKAAPVVVGGPAVDAGGHGDDEGGDGGVICANRDLLKRMMEGVVDDDDSHTVPFHDNDEDDHPQSLARGLRPGSPDVTQLQQRSIPTLVAGTSPKAPRVAAAGPAPTVIRAAPTVAQTAPRAVPAASAISRVDAVTLRPGSPPAIMAAVKAAATVPRPAPAPAGSVATGPPSQNIVSSVRPGSRSGYAPPPASTVQPLRQHAVKTGPAAKGYANIHTVQSKAPSAANPAVKVAAKPRCGPQVFDLLNKLGNVGPKAISPNALPEQAGAEEVDLGHDADERPLGQPTSEDAFVMPDESDDEETSLAARPAVVASAGGGNSLQRTESAQAVLGQKTTVDTDASRPPPAPHIESAAEYVERVQRGMSEVPAGSAPISPASGSVPAPMSPSGRGTGRARSSDSRPAPVANRAPSGLPNGADRGGPRSRSSDPRQAVMAARQSASWPGDSDEESSDGEDGIAKENRSRGVGARPVQWKADVRSIVQSYAREERARDEAASQAAPERVAGARRPPKAPDAKEPKQGEELVYSRKPRDVEYKPATVESYKERYGAKEVKLGTLGPDLDDDGLLRKKAIQEKVKQFSKELHRINAQRQANAQPPKPEPKPEPKSNARAKALEFAKNSVPKPKVAPKAPVQPEVPSPVPGVGPGDVAEAVAAAEQAIALEAMEARHLEDRAKVAQIKEFLQQLPVCVS